MPGIQLILSDMDDTLAPHMSNTISDTVRQVIREVENKGIQISVVTGRGHVHAKDTLTILGIEGPCVFDGGATIADAVTGNIVWKQWLSVESVRRVVSLIQPYCSEAFFTASYDMVAMGSIDITTINEESPCVFALVNTEKDMQSLTVALSKLDNINVYPTHGSHPVTSQKSLVVQITHKLANKFHGTEALRGILDIPREHTLAIGDGNNDIPLFENAQIKVAMGNATEVLKDAADHVVGSLEQDGFAEAMRKYVL